MLGLRRSKAKTRRARILIVDDQREMVEIIRDRLEHGGWEIATASNGAEGLEKAASHRALRLLLGNVRNASGPPAAEQSSGVDRQGIE